MSSDEFVEETEIDVVAVIPAHLKEFQSVAVVSVTASELYLTIDGQKLKGKITDAMGTNLFFRLNEETQEPDLVASCDKAATLEHVFYLPRDEFTKPFVPTDALNPPK